MWTCNTCVRRHEAIGLLPWPAAVPAALPLRLPKASHAVHKHADAGTADALCCPGHKKGVGTACRGVMI